MKSKKTSPPTGKPLRSNLLFAEEIESLRANKLLRTMNCIESPPGARISIGGKPLINFSSNDYLGLSGHPKIARAARDGLRKYGIGSGASRLLSGTYSPHAELESGIARFKRSKAALLFNTGYAANTGVIPVIAGKESVIFSDQLNHASIVDGARLAKAEVEVYRHRDMNHLESLLTKSSRRKGAKRRIVVTETVFSMDGDITPLTDIVNICEKYDSMLMIDDAHGTGVLGKTGRGGLEHFRLRSNNIIQMGTFSKALGCYGAYVAGSRELINLLTSRARSFIYSTSLPPAVAAAGVKALEICEHSSEGRRGRLWKNRQRLFEGLSRMGLNTLDSETPVIPVLAGDVEETLKLGKYLLKEGVYAPAIRPPTVPEGKCRIRFSVTAAHKYSDIDMLIGCLNEYRGLTNLKLMTSDF